jgi:hypothetical protein
MYGIGRLVDGKIGRLEDWWIERLKEEGARW